MCVEGVPLYNSCVCHTNREALAWDSFKADFMAREFLDHECWTISVLGCTRHSTRGLISQGHVFFHPERMTSLPAPCFFRMQFHWGVTLWDSCFFCEEISVPTPPSPHTHIWVWKIYRPLFLEMLKQKGLWRLLNTHQSIAASAYITTALVFSSCFISAPGIYSFFFFPPASSEAHLLLFIFVF